MKHDVFLSYRQDGGVENLTQESSRGEKPVSNHDNEKFNKAFGMNMANVESEKSAAIDNLAKETTHGELPQWVFAKQGDGRYVGVSDPNVTAEKGFTQALMRAWMLFQFDQYVNVSSNRESYVDIFSSNYSCSFIDDMNTENTLAVSLTPIKQHISNYGEYFVEFEIGKSGANSYVFSSEEGEVISVSRRYECKTVNQITDCKGNVCAIINSSKYGKDTSLYNVLDINRL